MPLLRDEPTIETGTESWYHDSPNSPEPVRDDVYRIPESIPPKAQKGWHREHKRMVREATANPVKLPNYDLTAHRAAINPLTNSFPALGSPGRRVGRWIYLRGATPKVVIDENGKTVLWWFPELLGQKTLDKFNDATNEFISYEMATHEGTKVLKPMGVTSNGKARAGLDTYTTNKGIYGAGTYVKAWHQLGQWDKKDFEPSRSLTNNRTTKQLIRRDNYFYASQNVDWKIDDMTNLIHPQFRRAQAELRMKLKSHPTISHIQRAITTDFPGRSVIVNRQSGEHFDKSGIPNGVDVLVGAGSVRSGGQVRFEDIKVQAELLPGAAIFFDGTSYRHAITPWKGEQRISVAYFAHRSVFQQLEIEIDFDLIDLADVKARVE